jgi:hypothetical protein
VIIEHKCDQFLKPNLRTVFETNLYPRAEFTNKLSHFVLENMFTGNLIESIEAFCIAINVPQQMIKRIALS